MLKLILRPHNSSFKLQLKTLGTVSHCIHSFIQRTYDHMTTHHHHHHRKNKHEYSLIPGYGSDDDNEDTEDNENEEEACVRKSNFVMGVLLLIYLVMKLSNTPDTLPESDLVAIQLAAASQNHSFDEGLVPQSFYSDLGLLDTSTASKSETSFFIHQDRKKGGSVSEDNLLPKKFRIYEIEDFRASHLYDFELSSNFRNKVTGQFKRDDVLAVTTRQLQKEPPMFSICSQDDQEYGTLELVATQGGFFDHSHVAYNITINGGEEEYYKIKSKDFSPSHFWMYNKKDELVAIATEHYGYYYTPYYLVRVAAGMDSALVVASFTFVISLFPSSNFLYRPSSP